MLNRNVLAIDLGASNGRGTVGRFDGGKLTAEVVHRFPNQVVEEGGRLFWDHRQLHCEILNSLEVCKRLGILIDCVAVDAWAQDYALLDSAGDLLGRPRSYRDPRTKASAPLVAKRFPAELLFAITGVGPVEFSTLNQLVHERRFNEATFESARALLFMPGLFTYLLCGELSCDFTIPSIANLMDIAARGISLEIVHAFGIGRLMPALQTPGTIVGKTSREVGELTGYDGVPVALVGGHDTASAASAVPAEGDFLFISSGTWSMLGITAGAPLLENEVMRCGYSNCLSADGKTMLLKGVNGMFLVQQCMREWLAAGLETSYEHLEGYALGHECRTTFDVDAVDASAASMPLEIARLLREGGRCEPSSPEDCYLMILGSLAAKYAKEVGELERLAGKTFGELHLVGGGARSKALKSLSERATGKRVVAGPCEATAIGNIAYQLVALGDIGRGDVASIVASYVDS